MGGTEHVNPGAPVPDWTAGLVIVGIIIPVVSITTMVYSCMLERRRARPPQPRDVEAAAALNRLHHRRWFPWRHFVRETEPETAHGQCWLDDDDNNYCRQNRNGRGSTTTITTRAEPGGAGGCLGAQSRTGSQGESKRESRTGGQSSTQRPSSLHRGEAEHEEETGQGRERQHRQQAPTTAATTTGEWQRHRFEWHQTHDQTPALHRQGQEQERQRPRDQGGNGEVVSTVASSTYSTDEYGRREGERGSLRLGLFAARNLTDHRIGRASGGYEPDDRGGEGGEPIPGPNHFTI